MTTGLSDHMQAVVDVLTAAGLAADRGRKPSTGGWSGAPGQSAYVGYVIVWGRPSQNVGHRDLDGLYDRRRPRYDIRTVGGTPTQADDLRDTAVDALTAAPIVVAGFDTVHMRFLSGFDSVPDWDPTPPIFYTGTELELWTEESS